MKPYAIISDTHCHAWQAFSQVQENGVNSRLELILKEFEHCAKTLTAMGGTRIYHAGDLFHVRGSVAPTVLNPVRDHLQWLVEQYGVEFCILPGNHDMELRHSSVVGNATSAVAGKGVSVVDLVGENDEVVMVPWIQEVSALKATLETMKVDDPANRDLIIHAPIDGVIPGLPDHGLTANYLASLGFRRVFAGHYHHHKDFRNGVYSVGAIAHHTWSDVGSAAGFLIVGEKVRHYTSFAPRFIDVPDDAENDQDMRDMIEGHYVRARVTTNKMADIEGLRKLLLDYGAKGVLIQSVREPTAARGPSPTVKAGATLEQSIADFIKTQDFEHKDEVALEAQRTLLEAA